MIRLNEYSLLRIFIQRPHKYCCFSSSCSSSNAQQMAADNLRKINQVLIANRGEIAIRVMRTAKKMGIKVTKMCQMYKINKFRQLLFTPMRTQIQFTQDSQTKPFELVNQVR
jgi:hypothetical protein